MRPLAGIARRHWRVLGAVAVAMVVASTVVVVLSKGGSHEGEAHPVSSNLELPRPDRSLAQATVTFLQADGAALVRFVEEANRLTAGTWNCAAAGSKLDAAGNPDQIRALAVELPDQILADLVLATATAVDDSLSACQIASGEDAAVAQLKVDLDLVARRRDELNAAAR